MSLLWVALHGTLAERSGVQPSLRGCDGERREHVRVMQLQAPHELFGQRNQGQAHFLGRK